jgi:hypothetical protein
MRFEQAWTSFLPFPISGCGCSSDRESGRAALLFVLRMIRTSGWLDRRGPQVAGEFCDAGGELAAALASEEVESDVRHVSCRRLTVKCERDRPAHEKARPAGNRAQLVPLCAGVCGVALSRRRMRLSHERML